MTPFQVGERIGRVLGPWVLPPLAIAVHAWWAVRNFWRGLAWGFFGEQE